MLVQQILRSKGDDGVATIAPDETVSKAVEVLAARRIGALVVSTDGKHVLGIVSERDIVRELGRRGPACLSDRVDQIMTAKIVGCSRDETARDVLQHMTDGRFRHMPVLEGDEMIGLVSIGDAVKGRLAELSMENEALEGMIKGF
ncbi:CBS domain-containing protein [Acidimangrovimonas pyrenivorans]|uniref:CBS domain-containing protein n=1 Tax=Acidimangrovimonas pyrenivorans TaxID=2030798 RepID=A0ABV7ACU6_9RHOB